MKKAAEATLARGYTHFRLEQASTSQGREFAGMYNSGQAYGTATTYGNTTYANVNGSNWSTPMYRKTANIGVTVVMLRAGDPGIENAFDAAQVVAKGGKA